MGNNNTNTNQPEPSHDTQYFTLDKKELEHRIASNNTENGVSKPLRIGATLATISALVTFVLVPALFNLPCDSSSCMGQMAFIGIWYISVPLLAYSLSLLIMSAIYHLNRKRIKKYHPYLWAFIPTIPLCFSIVALIRLTLGV